MSGGTGPGRVRPSQAADARIAAALVGLKKHTRHTAVASYAARLNDVLQVVTAHHAAGGRQQGGSRHNVDAVNRAALAMLVGHFQGFVQDLFLEVWATKYGGTGGPEVLRRLRFSNPSPDEMDGLFAIVGVADITKLAEPRKTASPAGPPRTVKVPRFAREQTKHQARQVVAEMVKLRHGTVHGAVGVKVNLRDVTVYLTDTTYLAIGMSDAI